MKFTEPRQKGIEHTGRNLRLIACAGSGKTEVVARRVVHLLMPDREDSLAPCNIVAFTFTNKAAAKLKERIFTRARQALGDVTGLAEIFGHDPRLLLYKTSRIGKYLKGDAS
jgi:DNA helicase-2/ATP-dependent DNA helicase PcrA